MLLRELLNVFNTFEMYRFYAYRQKALRFA